MACIGTLESTSCMCPLPIGLSSVWLGVLAAWCGARQAAHARFYVVLLSPSVESTFGRISGPVISEGVDISGIPSIFKHAFLGGEFSELFGTGQSIVPILHRYFISVARVVVDLDGKGGAGCAGSSRGVCCESSGLVARA